MRWLKEVCKLPTIFEPKVTCEKGVPIDFNVPFGDRQIELVCQINKFGRIPHFYATVDVLLANTEYPERFISSDGKDRDIVGTPLDEETMKHLLKFMYNVDYNYKRPFDDELYLKLYRAAKQMGFHLIVNKLVNEVKKYKNIFLGFIFSEIPDGMRCAWARGMTVCEICEMIEHPEYTSTRGELFSETAVNVMLQVFIEDRRRPVFSKCYRCEKYLHKPRLIALNLH